MIHCNIVTFSIVIPIQINCKTHCNSFSCDDVLLKYHYYYYYYYYYYVTPSSWCDNLRNTLLRKRTEVVI